MLKQFEILWDGHLDSVKAMQHRIELGAKDSRTVPSARYRAAHEGKEFKNQKINQMLDLAFI